MDFDFSSIDLDKLKELYNPVNFEVPKSREYFQLKEINENVTKQLGVMSNQLDTLKNNQDLLSEQVDLTKAESESSSKASKSAKFWAIMSFIIALIALAFSVFSYIFPR